MPVESSRPPIDLLARIQTPENIEFQYRLAGPFRRLPAFLIDVFVRGLIITAVWIVFLFAGGILFGGMGFGTNLIIFFLVVFQFFLQWSYGAFFETYWNGQTPGKWLCGLRVISVDGRPINISQAIVRNLLRSADLFPTGIVGLIATSVTQRFQRIGDLAAGTMVIVNQVSWVPTNVRFEDARVASLSEHIPPDFRLSSTLAKAIALYVERRSRIPIGRRLELANYLAKPLLIKFEFRDDTSSDLLLCAIYYREFMVRDAFNADNHSGRGPYLPPPTMASTSSVPTLANSNEQIAAPPVLARATPSQSVVN
ncbi:RDD family protein [Pirellulaceae bacterium SH449]